MDGKKAANTIKRGTKTRTRSSKKGDGTKGGSRGKQKAKEEQAEGQIGKKKPEMTSTFNKAGNQAMKANSQFWQRCPDFARTWGH